MSVRNPGSNALLDGVHHSDTLAGSVVRGDLIIGNSTPKWARLAIGAAGTVLIGGTDPAWTSAPTITTLNTDNVTISATAGGLGIGQMAYRSTEGLFIRGRAGSTSDFSLMNGTSGNTVLDNPTNTINIRFLGRVGIGTVPSTSAALEVASTTGAILIPRMTTTQKNALTAVNGMIVYDSTLGKFQGYEAGAWNNFSLL